ncbi:hypothetical protein [Anabaena sp. PCC 7108]|uniref:hypothetical protein n=1 Tax=Anabaena sp. PCC 7108 TaxID=163908 RepID=UPI000377AF4B|nr:hypothetical protein [Anabaena sp. PCC 7108]
MTDYIEYLHDKIQHAGLSDDEIEYSHSLYQKLINRQYMENGRSKTKQGILDQLLNSAENIDNSFIEGAISSVIIYHQIAEEWLYDLLELIRFLIDLMLYPERIKHKSTDNLHLNGFIQEIESSIDFDKKKEIIEYAKDVNKYRNQIAHDLLKKDSLKLITQDAEKFSEHFTKMSKALEGTKEEPYGARESLLEKIKYYSKWSDAFEDKYKSLLTEILEDNEVKFLSQEEFDTEIDNK